MNLTDDARDIGYALRSHLGNNVSGVGVDTATFVSLDRVKDKSPAQIVSALGELERNGCVRLSPCIGSPREGVPAELLTIAKISIQEPLQKYFDDMGI